MKKKIIIQQLVLDQIYMEVRNPELSQNPILVADNSQERDTQVTCNTQPGDRTLSVCEP